MSDNNPLNKREKGLEDEWIRNREREQAEEQRKAAGKPADDGAGKPGQQPKPARTEQKPTSGLGHVLFWLVVAAAAMAAFYLVG